VLVEPGATGYFATLSDYIHLNPVRARLVEPTGRLFDYAWSSYPAYLVPRLRPAWLVTEVVLGELRLKDDAKGRKRYGERMRTRAVSEWRGENDSEDRRHLRRGWCLGGEAFRERMREMIKSD